MDIFNIQKLISDRICTANMFFLSFHRIIIIRYEIRVFLMHFRVSPRTFPWERKPFGWGSKGSLESVLLLAMTQRKWLVSLCATLNYT